MGWANPTIEAMCDNCMCSEVIDLCETAHGWDARYVDGHLIDLGWSIDGNKLLCPDCTEEMKTKDDDSDDLGR